MSTSVTERNTRTTLAYVAAALVCAVFGAVYELFSHEVYSASMIYAFLIPLAGGALPFGIFAAKGTRKYPRTCSILLYHFGIATLTVGSIVKGILDIYGTTNGLLSVYWFAGAALTLTSVLLSIIDCARQKT